MSEIIQDFKQDYGRKEKIKEIYHLSTEPFYVGSGAGGVVYCVSMKKADEKVTSIEEKAIKIVPGIAMKVFESITENELEQKYKEIEITIEENDIQVKREISNWQMASNCEHILPLDDNVQIIKWKYNEYIGIDYALPMPFASCLTKIIDKYKKDDCTLNETEDKIIQIGIDLCKALEELENLPTPICHRDIKPANIYYLNGKYCLGDFGISIETGKTQRTGTGTEAYRSPVQAKHVPQSERDHRQDIYSLGLVLYELADKHRIGDYTSDLSMRRQLPHLTNQYSRGLDQIIHRATQYYVNGRFQHASEFRESLEKLQADRTFKLYDEEERYRTKDPEYIDSPYAEIEIVFSPETLWNAGAFWYEKSKEEGNRFLKRNIDEKIMPLATEKNQDSYRFPVNVYKEEDIEHSKIELSQIISKIEEIDDMYLIGEGGIGKTTALYSVMENTYKDAFYPEDNEKVVIPIFIELSKAPIQYVRAYDSFSSTFIRRYIYCLTEMRREKLGTTEQEKMLHDVMERDEISELEQMDSLLMKENSKAHYLLLLDGLNEVSRKQFEPDAQGNSGSAAEMISYEIQKLQTYKNVTVVITSRADETFYFGENITKYHLMGLEEDTIKEYLEKYNISAENIESNKRLKETLKVPLFLKLYSKLSSVEKISTPGEILYAFFNERTHEYSIRLRLREIEAEQQQFKAPYMVNFITEKMQLFIMDFLIPEIGWYMEKNELYTIDKDTIKCIIEPVLRGEQDIDICGKYGRAFFKEYHNGVDGSVNTQTYAEQLLKLNSHGDYVDDIIDHCVYSLGIFYVNNQEYGFIHQHIRDYFAALKIVTLFKMALYVAENNRDEGYKYLKPFNKEILHESVSVYIGEILSEYKINNKRTEISKRDSLLEKCIDLYRKKFDLKDEVQNGLYNLLKIINNSRKTLSELDLSYLDLRNCFLNGTNLEGTNLDYSIVERKNLFPFGHTGSVVKAIFSSCGKYIFTAGYDGTIRQWHTLSQKYIGTVIKITDSTINNIELSSNGKLLLVCTSKYCLIYDAKTYKELHRYKGAFEGTFDKNNKYLAIAYYRKSIQIIKLESFTNIKISERLFRGRLNGRESRNIILFSPDSKYFIFLNESNEIEVWNIKRKQKIGKYHVKGYITAFDFDSQGKKLVLYDTRNGLRIINFEPLCFKEETKTVISSKMSLKQLDESDVATILVESAFKGNTRVISKNQQWKIQQALVQRECVRSVKFVSNDKYLLIVYEDGMIRLYDVRNESTENLSEYILQGDCSHQTEYISEYKGMYDEYIVTGGLDATVKIWSLRTKQCIGIIKGGYTGAISDAKFSPDGKIIASVTGNEEIFIWDAKKGTFMTSLETENYAITKIAFSVSGRLLAAGTENGMLILYRKNGQKYNILWTEKVYDGAISNIEISEKEDSILVSSYDSFIRIFNITLKKVREFQSRASWTKSSIFGFNEKSILSCSQGWIEQFSNQNTKELAEIIEEYKLPYIEKNSVRKFISTNLEEGYWNAQCVVRSPDNKYIAIRWIGGLSGAKIEIRNAQNTNVCVAILNTKSDRDNISFSLDGKYLIAASGERFIKIYETNHWECVKVLQGYQGKKHHFLQKNKQYARVTCVGGSKDRTFLSGSDDGALRIWTPFAYENEYKRMTMSDIYDKNILKRIGKIVYGGLDNLAERIVPMESSSKDIYECQYVLPHVSGLKLKNTSIKNLHPNSDLKEEDFVLMKIYGAITE